MENLKEFIDDLLPSSYVKASEQKEQHRAEESKSETQLISSLEDHCLYKFVESLRNSLQLEQEQAFDWHWFFTSKPARDYTDEELLDQGFEVCGFAVQYALLQVQQSSFKKVICSAPARQQLLNLVEVLWIESQVSRGYKYQPKNVFPANQQKKQAVYDWFKQQKEFKRDPEPEYELEFPIEQQHEKRQPRDRAEVFLLLLAQACFVPYPVAFKKISEDPWLCLQEKLPSAADEALTVAGLSKKSILNNKKKMLLYIRLVSHYYADKQVRSGSSAANTQMSKLRADETKQILELLKNSHSRE